MLITVINVLLPPQYIFVAIAVSLPIPSGVFFPIFIIGEPRLIFLILVLRNYDALSLPLSLSPCLPPSLPPQVLGLVVSLVNSWL